MNLDVGNYIKLMKTYTIFSSFFQEDKMLKQSWEHTVVVSIPVGFFVFRFWNKQAKPWLFEVVSVRWLCQKVIGVKFKKT